MGIMQTRLAEERSGAPYDARRVANLILDEGDRVGIALTHLALQKLLYFAHGRHLSAHQKALVYGYFEAWRYGPVHPDVYGAFCNMGSGAIKQRVENVDILSEKMTMESVPLPEIPTSDIRAWEAVRMVLASCGKLHPYQLVKLSHAEGGAWHYTVSNAKIKGVLGMKIPNELISRQFGKHRLIPGERERVPDHDKPPYRVYA